ncbi:aspartate aminotransferase family protein [Gordonia sp. (in: high G+C Gram-positive bacteria)]|uniref:aspartate aminotransferase family protein n=1 Tax=Gordonia sp. (in: high G+C Gram-positive bacteria) TaxID=84139 RepID=UPI003C767BA3
MSSLVAFVEATRFMNAAGVSNTTIAEQVEYATAVLAHQMLDALRQIDAQDFETDQATVDVFAHTSAAFAHGMGGGGRRVDDHGDGGPFRTSRSSRAGREVARCTAHALVELTTTTHKTSRRTMGIDSSRAAFKRTQGSLAAGVSSGLRRAMQPVPLFVERAVGAHVWDLDGDRYIDYVMAWGPLVHGHSDVHIIDAVQRVVSSMQVVGMGHRLEYEAAEAVLDAVPGAERLVWANTGTEAVQVALRLARAATSRRRIVKMTKAYHGWHDSVYASVDAGDTGETAVPASRGQSPNAYADLVISQFNDIDSICRLLEDAEEREIAAVLVDPIMSNAGVLEPRDGFLATLRELCDRHGVILIFDEVITGFRIARGGAAERFGVTPDLSVFGKAIAGGFTQSAVVGKAEIVDLVTDGVMHAGTFNGNPVALAAVKASMELCAAPHMYSRLDDLGAAFEKEIGAVLTEAGTGSSLRTVGSLLQFVPGDDQATSLHGTGGLWSGISAAMLEAGVVFTPSGKIFLSTAHSPADIRQTADRLADALRVISVPST